MLLPEAIAAIDCADRARQLAAQPVAVQPIRRSALIDALMPHLPTTAQ